MKTPISRMFFLITLFLFTAFNSCTAENELFSEVIQEDIEKQIEEEEAEETTEETNNDDNTDEDEDSVVDDGVASELKAFPTAYGAGAYASGGRGGKVYYVTTTEDTGQEGSLRWAFTRRGPKIVVFKVGGIFELTRGRIKLTSLHNDTTIAGQTAPGDGVTITGDYMLFSGVDNLIMRYVRLRGIQNSSLENSDIITAVDCTNIIIDHCSGSWGTDEIWSFTSREQGGFTGNITIQRSIFAEMHPDHSTATIFGSFSPYYETNAGSFSWNNNYVYNISHRFPNATGNGDFEIKNNVIYNWAYRLTRVNGAGVINQQNNYYHAGPRTISWGNSEEGGVMGTLNRVAYGDLLPTIYATGNLVEPNIISDPSADNMVMWRWFLNTGGKSRNDVVDKSLELSSEPQPLGSALPLLSANEAYDNVLSNVGANRSLNANGTYTVNLDALDQSYIQASRNNSGPSRYRNPGEWSLPPHNNPNNNEPYVDSDNDGMPDVWEISKGLNPDVDDSAGDLDGDGYTNIEEFINLVDVL